MNGGFDSGWGSESGEKGFGRVALCHVIDKALPLPSPAALVMPSQPATERLPEIGVEEAFVHMHGAEGVHADDTHTQTRFAVFELRMISAFSGFGQCLLDRHRLCFLHLLLSKRHCLIVIPMSEK